MTSSPEGRQALDATGLKAAHRVMFERVAYGDEISPRDMEAAIGAYLSALPAPVAAAPVGVKELEWQKKPNSKDEFADTVCGRYEIGIVGGGYIATVRIINDGQWDDLVFAQGICAKKDAKAAAQADYEAHIRSALIAPAKPAVDLVEARWPTTPEPWELEAAAIFMDHVEDDETDSVHRVAAFLRSVAALQAPATPDTQTEVEK